MTPFSSAAFWAFTTMEWFAMYNAETIGDWADYLVDLECRVDADITTASGEILLVLWTMHEDERLPFYVRCMASSLARGIEAVS